MTQEERKMLKLLKRRVRMVGRGAVADYLNMPYGTLSNKLNGNIRTTAEEAEKIENAVRTLEAQID